MMIKEIPLLLLEEENGKIMGDDLKGAEILEAEKKDLAASEIIPSSLATNNSIAGDSLSMMKKELNSNEGNTQQQQQQLHKTIILGDDEDDSSKEDESENSSLRKSDSFTLSTGEDLSTYPSRFSFEYLLIKGILHPKMVSITLFIQYHTILFYSFYYQDFYSTVVLAISFIVGFLVNTRFALNSIWAAVKVGSDKAGNAEDDKGRMICNLILFSLRFYYLRSMRMMLMPIYFMIITSNNNLKREDMIWTLFPTYYISLHFIGNLGYRFLLLLIGQSTEDFGFFFSENISTMMCCNV